MNRQPSVCPKCGRELQIANQEHVCGLYPLEPHFENRDPLGQVTFDWTCEQLGELGEFNILPMKTFIAFANHVNFAFLKTRKSGTDLSLVLDSPPTYREFQLVTVYSRTKAIYKTTLQDASELDEDLAELLASAHRLTGR